MAWYFNDNYPWIGMLFCAPIIGLWYWCTDQYIVQRTLGAPNETEARRGSIWAAFLKLLPVFIFIIPGMIAFALAKSGYALSRCGWFSDRSLCYLASGRPVVAQDTGFGCFLPSGEGILPFHDLETAATAVEMMQRDYFCHCTAARAAAETVFDARRVLGRLLERLL